MIPATVIEATAAGMSDIGPIIAVTSDTAPGGNDPCHR